MATEDLVVRDESRYTGGVLPPITWTEESEDHIARHGVTPEEVQEALYTRPRWITPGRGGTTLVFAMTDAGRYLLVVIAPAHDGGVYVVTARDLNDSERRTFRRKDADMTTGDLDALREHYDHADTSAELEKAKLDESVISEPMVGITIRLPATALDAARDVARERGIKVTALLREWIEQNLGGEADDDRLVSVRDLKSFIAQKSKTTTRSSKATVRSAMSGKWVSKTGSTRARTASASATKTMQSRTR